MFISLDLQYTPIFHSHEAMPKAAYNRIKLNQPHTTQIVTEITTLYVENEPTVLLGRIAFPQAGTKCI